jgi:hypothetical protein
MSPMVPLQRLVQIRPNPNSRVRARPFGTGLSLAPTVGVKAGIPEPPLWAQQATSKLYSEVPTTCRKLPMPWTPNDAERHTHKASTWNLRELWGENRQRVFGTNRRRRPRHPGSERGRRAAGGRLLAARFSQPGVLRPAAASSPHCAQKSLSEELSAVGSHRASMGARIANPEAQK